MMMMMMMMIAMMMMMITVMMMREPWYVELAKAWIQATPGSEGPDGIPEPDYDDEYDEY